MRFKRKVIDTFNRIEDHIHRILDIIDKHRIMIEDIYNKIEGNK